MGVLVGFVLGYVVGAKAGPEGYDRLRDAWRDIRDSEEWKGLVGTARAFVDDAVTRGGAAITGRLEAVNSGDGRLSDVWRGLGGDRELARIVSAIGESSAVQDLVERGGALLSGLVERGKTALEQSGLGGRS